MKVKLIIRGAEGELVLNHADCDCIIIEGDYVLGFTDGSMIVKEDKHLDTGYPDEFTENP